MFGIPSFDTPLTYLGVLLLTLGIYITLSGFGILKIEKYSTPEGVKSWSTGLLLVLAGLAILFVLPGYQATTGKQQEIGFVGCRDNPNLGIVDADTQVVLTWGWNGIDSETKRNELVSISSFILELDGEAQDLSGIQPVFNSNDTVIWKLNVGKLTPGFHTARLTRIFSQDYSDSSNYVSTGRMEPDVCELTVK